MLTRTNRILIWGVAFALGELVVGPTRAAETFTKMGAAEAAILKALDNTTTAEFIEEPLTSVVDFLKDFHQIQIQIDESALEDCAIDKTKPVTKSLSGVSLCSALNLILHDLGLDWTIANEVLLITTPEVAETTFVTRVYDVGDLVLVRDGAGKLWRDFDSITEVLKSTIKPDSWKDVGGPGSIAPFELRGAAGLVVRHTPKVHQEVAQLLKDLTELAKKYGDDTYPVREQPPSTEFPPKMGMGAGMMGGSGPAPSHKPAEF